MYQHYHNCYNCYNGFVALRTNASSIPAFSFWACWKILEQKALHGSYPFIYIPTTTRRLFCIMSSDDGTSTCLTVGYSYVRSASFLGARYAHMGLLYITYGVHVASVWIRCHLVRRLQRIEASIFFNEKHNSLRLWSTFSFVPPKLSTLLCVLLRRL